jgi:hypothetical protein
MNDALNTLLSTKAASPAVTAQSTLRFEADLCRRRLASNIVSNQSDSCRHPPLPNAGLQKNHRPQGAGHSPSAPTRRLFVHSH